MDVRGQTAHGRQPYALGAHVSQHKEACIAVSQLAGLVWQRLGGFCTCSGGFILA